MSEPKREWGPEDEEAAREGHSISLGNIRRVRRTTKKSKTKTVDTRVLENAFDEHYGVAGYGAKGEEVVVDGVNLSKENKFDGKGKEDKFHMKGRGDVFLHYGTKGRGEEDENS